MCNVEQALACPEMAYRPRNYWGWLENITPEETRWQIDRMAEAGIGGYVAHARGGLTMPYAGEQWMASVRAMIDQGRKYGMVSIIDDEHGWPSGFGAGKVNGKGEKYQLKYLKSELVPESEPQKPHTLGAWPRADGMQLRVYAEVDPYYVDNMDPDVVDAFLEASYEDYDRQVGSEFGAGGLYGIFSDEPQTARYATPWSDTLPALYEKEYGEPLLPQLYKVFENAPGCEQLRCRLYGLMARCFAENYAGRINRWCDAHGLAFTGHTCLEEDFAGQLRCAVSTMPFYENMTVPGIDWLTRDRLSNLAILQLTSVAAQTGKKRVLSEMFGCAGWSITPEGMKRIAQWQHMFGINDQLQHLGLYSLRGSRKREYPASIFYQQPWFHKLGAYNDYFARISKLLAESRQQTDLLVLHPMRTAWALYDGTEASLRSLTDEFSALLDTLLRLGRSPHLGDETLLAKHGRVADGKLEVGACRYSRVLLPALATMDSTTYALLQKFAAAGGEIFVLGGLPGMLDGVPAKPELPCTVIEGSDDSLKAAFPVPVELCGGNAFTYLTRWNWRGEEFWYLVNNGEEAVDGAALCGTEAFSVYSYDALHNRLARQPMDVSRIRLESGEALLLFVGDKTNAAPAKTSVYANRLVLDGSWTLESTTDNALTLDTCRLSFDGVEYGEEEYVLDIQNRLLKGGMDRDVWLKFRFVSTFDTELFLLAEDPARCTITVNGEPVGEPCGWRVDKCLEAMPIRVRTGENEVVIARRFENDDRVYYVKNNHIHEAEANRITVNTELESIYLWGRFAVSGEFTNTNGERRTVSAKPGFTLHPLPDELNIAHLEQEGLLFFAGELTLSRSFSAKTDTCALVRIARPDAGMTEIELNGESHTLLWAPFECPVRLKAGENTIRVTLTNSCRNLFGPHYSKQYDTYAVSPFSYGRETEDMHFVRFGIEGGVEILF